jgi:hypothetical protein
LAASPWTVLPRVAGESAGTAGASVGDAEPSSAVSVASANAILHSFGIRDSLPARRARSRAIPVIAKRATGGRALSVA